MNNKAVNFAPPVTSSQAWNRETYKDILLGLTESSPIKDENHNTIDIQKGDQSTDDVSIIESPTLNNITSDCKSLIATAFFEPETSRNIVSIPGSKTDNEHTVLGSESNIKNLETEEYIESTEEKGFSFEEFIKKFQDLDCRKNCSSINKDDLKYNDRSLHIYANDHGRVYRRDRGGWRPRGARGFRAQRRPRPFVRYYESYRPRGQDFVNKTRSYNNHWRYNGQSNVQRFQYRGSFRGARLDRGDARGRKHLLSVSSQTEETNVDQRVKTENSIETVSCSVAETETQDIPGRVSDRKDSCISNGSERLNSESYPETSDLESDIEIIIDPSAFVFDHRKLVLP